MFLDNLLNGVSDFFSGVFDGDNNPLSGLGGMFGNDNGSPFESLTNPSSWWDKFKNGRTNEVNYDIAKENLGYQRDRNEIEDARYEEETAYNRAFAEEDRDYQRRFAEEERDYQRALQQEIFNREDTALERQASSLSSMGINPLSQNMNGLGAGQALSSPAPSVGSAPSASTRGGNALHNDFQMQDTGVLGAITPLMSMFNTIDNINTAGLQRDSIREQNDYQRLINQEKEIELRFKDIRLQKELEDLSAGTENKKANTAATKSSTKRAEELHPSQLLDSKASAERNERENQFQKDWDVTDNTSSQVRAGVDIGTRFLTESKKQEELESKSPLSITGRTLKSSAETVGRALNNTIGEGARAVYKFFSEPKRYKYKNGKRVRIAIGDDDWF